MVYYRWTTTEKHERFRVRRLINYEGNPDVSYYGHRGIVTWHKVCNISDIAVDLFCREFAAKDAFFFFLGYSMPQSCIKGTHHERMEGEQKCDSFLTSAVDVRERSNSNLDRFTPEERPPGTHWIGGWVGSMAGLDILDKTETSRPLRNSNPGFSSP
jgi:hypothetical protein